MNMLLISEWVLPIFRTSGPRCAGKWAACESCEGLSIPPGAVHLHSMSHSLHQLLLLAVLLLQQDITRCIIQFMYFSANRLVNITLQYMQCKFSWDVEKGIAFCGPAVSGSGSCRTNFFPCVRQGSCQERNRKKFPSDYWKAIKFWIDKSRPANCEQMRVFR